MNFCINCKHFIKTTGRMPALCGSNKLGMNLVYGVILMDNAHNVRQNEKECGKDGEWFEERKIEPKRPSFWKRIFA